ncbi:MAG: hypothetical protein NC131_01210 [Roseburia sp.]|nr:hypothetical protein [Roseburia sp.]
MRSISDITNQRFGRLVAIRCVKKDENHQQFWLCKCDCGNEKIIRRSDLLRKPIGTQSCGCLAREIKVKRFTKHGLETSNKRLYKIWDSMKQRTNPNVVSCRGNYRKNGITVCDEWRNDFPAFYDWAMTNGYSENLTIDRIDNNKGYSPENCRWVDMKVQANNRSNNTLITYKGETKTLAQWCEQYNIKSDTVTHRMKRGYSFEKAITEPIDKLVRYEYKGKLLTRAEMSELSGLPISCIQNRIQHGWDIERIMTQPQRITKRTPNT